MKKQLLILSMLIGIFTTTNAQIQFADENFKNAILNHTNPVIDTNGNGEIDIKEAFVTTRLIISNENISNLSGIEYFTRLETLHAPFNYLTEIDLSNNTNLIELWLGYNNLNTIDVSKLTNLRGLGVNNNNLTALDLRNGNLNTLFFSGNPILEAVFLSGQDVSNMYLIISDCPNLEFICANKSDIDFIISEFDALGQTDVYVHPYCRESYLNPRFSDYFIISPNPTTGILNLQVFDSASSLIMGFFSVYNEAGILINRYSKTTRTFDFSNLPPGRYIFKVSSKKADLSTQFIKI